MKLFRRLICCISGHRWSPWNLFVAHYRDGITKDATRRVCACCDRRETFIIPFKQFTLTKSAR